MKKHKLLAVVLVLVMTLSLLPTAALADEEDVSQLNAATTITTAEDLTTLVTNGGEGVLGSDLKVTFPTTVSQNVTLDLGKNKLTLDNILSISISEGKSLTIKNGSIVANGYTAGTYGVFMPQANASTTLETVTMTTTGAALFPAGSASAVTVTDSNITAGTYVVGTNATPGQSNNVNITLSNSTFSTTGYVNNDRDTCTVMINVPGALNVNNCTIKGGRQAVLVRAGTASISNSEIVLENLYDRSDKDSYENADWGQGNNLPMGALVVGNRSASYQNAANCTLTNTSVSGGRIYTYGNTGDSIGATLSINNTADDKAISGELVKGNDNANIIVENGSFTDIANAVKYAKEGATIKLAGDVELTSMITLNKNLTLDLNGHKLARADGNDIVQVINNATLKIEGNTAGSSVYGRINLGVANNNNGNAILNGGTYSCRNGQTVLHINGTCLDSDVTISGATITSPTDNGIQLNGAGTFLIENSKITGATAVYIKSGNTTIRNCIFNGTMTPANYTYNGNGSNPTGDAVVIDACNYPGGNPTVNIESGTFTGTKAAIGYYQHTGSDTTKAPGSAMINVTGGTFSSDPSTYVVSGYAAVKTGESEWKVGRIYSANFTVSPSDATVVLKQGNEVVGTSQANAYTDLNSALTYTYTVSRSGYVTKTDTISAPVSDLTTNISVTLNPVYTDSGSSSGSNTSSTTEKNPDGSTTTTTTDKKTGTVTETTKNTDGSTTTVETKKDGTVTETNKAANGTTGTVVTDKNGDVTEVKSTVSAKAVTEAAKTGTAVTLPVEVPAAKTTEDAPAVQVSVPKSAGSVKVEVPVEKVTPGTVAVIVNADGTEKIVSTSMVTENGVALKLDGSATVKIIDNTKTFSDVPATNVFYNEISSLSAREIMIGKAGDKFDLHSTVTLDQIANVAGRITGAVDVKDFSAGVTWGAESGLQTGNVAATRGDVLKALYIAAGSPAVEDTTILAKFKDASGIPADMAAIAAWAAQNGILKGDLSGNANLTTNVTRGQACALAGRTMGTLA